MRIIALFILLVLTGCTANKASFAQGVFAGQAQTKIVSNHDEEAKESSYWQSVAYGYQRRDIETVGAAARAKAASYNSPALAAENGWNAAVIYTREMLNLAQVHAQANANRDGRTQVAGILSQTPIDVFNMSKKQDKARSDFTKSTVTMGITETANILVEWQAAEAKASALKETEKREADLTKREKTLAERIAELDKPHETPSGS